MLQVTTLVHLIENRHLEATGIQDGATECLLGARGTLEERPDGGEVL